MHTETEAVVVIVPGSPMLDELVADMLEEETRTQQVPKSNWHPRPQYNSVSPLCLVSYLVTKVRPWNIPEPILAATRA